MGINQQIASMQPEMTAWRHDFHKHPELGYQEFRTASRIGEMLEGWGVSVHSGIGGTGVVGVLEGRNPSRRHLGLRADMDALPMTEDNDFSHRSQTDGVFHGCGHDGHTTMLLGAARHLAEHRDFDGTVNFIFQPAEESLGGGGAMVKDGLFERFPCDEVYALHNWPPMDLGQAGIRSGPIMAGVDTFRIELTGKGGHAAMPDLCIDPVVMAAQAVQSFQSIVSRKMNPRDTAVISVTRLNAGSADNVIADTATLTGTIRTFDTGVQDIIHQSMEAVLQGICSMHDASYTIEISKIMPPTINHREQAELAANVAESILGEGTVDRDVTPTMGGEDFSFMLNERPGAYIWLGQGGERHSCMVHNPSYDFNDNLLPIGASWFASMAMSSH